MGKDAGNWPDDVIEDGWTAVEGDPYDTGGATTTVQFEKGSPRRIKVGGLEVNGEKVPVYGLATSQRVVVFDASVGKFRYVDAGRLDADSDQRIHLDQYPPEPLDASKDLDVAFTANTPESATRRRPHANSGRVGVKSIGK